MSKNNLKDYEELRRISNSKSQATGVQFSEQTWSLAICITLTDLQSKKQTSN